MKTLIFTLVATVVFGAVNIEGMAKEERRTRHADKRNNDSRKKREKLRTDLERACNSAHIKPTQKNIDSYAGKLIAYKKNIQRSKEKSAASPA